MKFSNLQYIIQSARRRMKCPECKKAYKIDEINIIDIYEDECMLDLFCENCKNGFSFSFEVEEVDGKVTVIDKETYRELTEKDISEMSSLLKDYKGGVDDLLKR